MITMNPVRRRFTRFLFRLMGLNIKYWRTQIESIWALSADERERWLSRTLAENAPVSSEGDAVRSLDELKQAPSLSKAALREQSKALPENRKRFGRHTAGTTGHPTHIWLNKDELARMLAVRDYCFSHYGIRVGDREARLWGRPQSGLKSHIKDGLMNRRVFHPAGPQAKAQVEQLLSYKPVYIYGYASLILEAARIIDRYNLVVSDIKCVICTAETILPIHKEYISRQLRAPVAEEYGSTEFDIIAFECRDGHRHLVNPWLVVDAGYEEVRVTDVSRLTQSLVKYEVGDAMQLEKTECMSLGSDVIIKHLEGRSIDRFAYINREEKFHSVEFAKAMNAYFKERNEGFEYCIYQYDYNRFQMDIESDTLVNKDDAISFLTSYIYELTGYNVSIELEKRDNSSSSGVKRSYFKQNIVDEPNRGV